MRKKTRRQEGRPARKMKSLAEKQIPSKSYQSGNKSASFFLQDIEMIRGSGFSVKVSATMAIIDAILVAVFTALYFKKKKGLAN